MTTTNILGGGLAQPEFEQNSNLPLITRRFLVSTALVLVAGQWVSLPIAPPRNTPYTPTELTRLAAMSAFPIEHVQVTEL